MRKMRLPNNALKIVFSGLIGLGLSSATPSVSANPSGCNGNHWHNPAAGNFVNDYTSATWVAGIGITNPRLQNSDWTQGNVTTIFPNYWGYINC
jgi:hypothetical protein